MKFDSKEKILVFSVRRHFNDGNGNAIDFRFSFWFNRNAGCRSDTTGTSIAQFNIYIRGDTNEYGNRNDESTVDVRRWFTKYVTNSTVRFDWSFWYNFNANNWNDR